MKIRTIVVLITIFVLLFTSGCTDKNFDLIHSQYKDLYVKTSAFVDEADSVTDILNNVNIDDLEKDLEELSILSSKLKEYCNTEREKVICSNIDLFYKPLERLLLAAMKKDLLDENVGMDIVNDAGSVHSARKKYLNEE